MSKQTQYVLLIPLLLSVLASCATAPESPPAAASVPTAEVKQVSNDFPTIDRVEYVIQCIEQHGGLQYLTLYPCACKIDKIATLMTYEEYTQARTFTFLRSTPGEKGGVFRDPPQAKALRKKIKEADKTAEAACFVKMP